MINSRKHIVAAVPEIWSISKIPDVAVSIKLFNPLSENKY
jgi:hypothetical protein